MSDFLTEVVLYRGIPFDKSYNHTIYFSNLTDQENYFHSKEVDAYHKFTNMSYQRINKNTIRVQMGYEDIIYCNYLSIKNKKNIGTPKTYYCFIDDVTYISDDVSEITYTLDIMQTYHPYQSYAFGECWIERQHSETDEKGEHLEDDYLVGEYTDNIDLNDYNEGLTKIYLNGSGNELYSRNGTFYYMVGTSITQGIFSAQFYCQYAIILGITKDITQKNGKNTTTSYDKLPSSVTLLGIPLVDTTKTHNITISNAPTHTGTYTFDGLQSLDTLMNYCINDGSNLQTNYDDVAFAIVVPFEYLNIDKWCAYDVVDGAIPRRDYAVYFYLKSDTFNITNREKTVNIKQTLDGYSPRNKKLYDYPYNMVTVSNLNGKIKDFKLHEFGDVNPYSSIKFNLSAYFTGGNFDFVLIPNKYENREDCIDNAILTNDLPTISWINNTFQTWLEQKSAQNMLSIVTGLMQVGLGIGQVAGGSTVSGSARMISGTSNIAGSIIERNVAETLPNTVNGQMSNSYNFAKGNTIGFQVFGRCLRKEFLEQIDNYFTMYGYAMKRYNYPRLDVRKYYTYIQTAGCIVKPFGSNQGMTASIQRQIANIYDKGITFWRYSVDDGITNPDVGNYRYNPCLPTSTNQ